jgi:hypothetical protein
MIFIDEASPVYARSGVAGSKWATDVANFNSLTAYDKAKIILFGVRQSLGTPSLLAPTNPSLPMPIPSSNIVDCPRGSPAISVGGQSLSGQFIQNKMAEIWPNIPTPSINNPIRIVIYIDISGSMTRFSIQPAIDQFIVLAKAQGFTIKEQLCTTEEYLSWIYKTATGSVSC